MFETTRQGGVFLTMVYAGLLCGVAYDILRLVRRMTHAGRMASAAVDLLFWLLAGGVSAYTLFRISNEPVRLYALLGALCGMLLYLAGMSEAIYGVIRTIVHAVRTVMRRLKRGHTKNS